MIQKELVEKKAWIGKSVPRKEDERLLKGQGTFTDDVNLPRQTYLWVLQSPYAHAYIRSIDKSRAASVPGVLAVLTGAEVKDAQTPFLQLTTPPGSNQRDYCLAVGKTHFVGEPVAAVVAETPEIARDATELIEVTYDLLPCVVDGEAALAEGAPVIHEECGTNVVWNGVYDYGDIDGALADADAVIEIPRLHFHRFASAPLECNAAVAAFDRGTGQYTFYCNNQMPQFAAMFMSPALGVPINKMRFVTQDIGGGFGNKITSYPYLTLLALLTKKVGRPVKWVEYRSQQLSSNAHGGERTFLDVKVAVQRDGTILGFSARAVDDAGAYCRYEPLGAVIWSQVVPACYRFRHVRVDFTQVVTNKAPCSPNRGYSRLQHMWLVERIVDITAKELGLDSVEIRHKNYIQPDEFPYTTPNGCIYDSGDYPRSLEMALSLIDYPSWVKRQAASQGSGKLIGIGIGSTLDSGSNNFGQSRIINPFLPFSGNGETANVKLDLYGELVVTLGTVPQGQGHETTSAQVVAEILGIDPDEVMVNVGHDTVRNVYTGFSGTYASQFAVTGLGAVQGAAKELRKSFQRLAAQRFGVQVEDIEVAGGKAFVKHDPERGLAFGEMANLVYTNNAELPDDFEVSLNCTYTYKPPFDPPDPATKTGNLTLTYASQIHACVVSVDEETGEIGILDYAAVDDCGRRINPMVVEGQVHGAAAHGIAAALFEAFPYDDEGQLRTSTFYDYNPATAVAVPDIKTGYIESPSPFSPNGAKGMGEGGGAPLHALSSAVQDALWASGRKAVVADTHLPKEVVYGLLRDDAASRHGVRMIAKGESR